MKTQRTARIARTVTNASTALVALAGGLAVLPIDSADLPMPPEWRPYLAGLTLISLAIRLVVVPTLDAILEAMKE